MPDTINVSTSLKIQVAVRANRICEYCRCSEKFSSTPFSVEHIIPRSLGGTNNFNNLAFACMG
jgi:5-methylcytosine-specific restriction endonuclease McrA